MFFFIKKAIALLATPIGFTLLLLLISLLTFKSKPRLSFKSLLFAFVFIFTCSFNPVAERLLAPLEQKYPSFTHSDKTIDYIAVLGCYHVNDDTLPAISKLKSCSLQRLNEALRIANMYPNAQVITSGHLVNSPISNAQVMKEAAVELGFDENKVIVEGFAKDTEEEAELIALRATRKNLVLVTNASHMPRAVNYFKHYGLDVIPAPTGHMVKGLELDKSWQYYMPQLTALEKTSRAFYAYLSLAWQWIKS